MSVRFLVRRGLRSIGAFALVTLFIGCAEDASNPVIELQARRDFGYTVGSLIEHHVKIELPAGTRVDPKLLPAPGPVSDSLDLRTIEWSQPDQSRLELRLSYLVLQGVKGPESSVIPPLKFSVRRGDGLAELQTPEWSFALMPVIPPGIPDEKIELRPMHETPAVPAGAGPWLFVCGLLSAGIFAFLIALRRGLFPALAEPPPFTAALRALTRPSFALNATQRYELALKRLHRAIDETAGATVLAVDLPAFLERHPAFGVVREQFADFFDVSQRHFFGSPDPTPISDTQHRDLLEFCRRCARIERGPR